VGEILRGAAERIEDDHVGRVSGEPAALIRQRFGYELRVQNPGIGGP
jgi:hypothetical protein